MTDTKPTIAVVGGTATAALAITAVYIPQYFRVVRAATVSAKEATYVEAARAMGAGPVTTPGMVCPWFTE